MNENEEINEDLDDERLACILTQSINIFRGSEVETWLNSKSKESLEELMKEIKEYSTRNVQSVKCPKCKTEFEHNMSTHALSYFECPNCEQKLALAKEKKGFKLYIDDQEHMGLMTSGPGGY